MAGWRARELCPDLTFVRGHFADYQRLSAQVMQILGSYTPALERVSIDEAFLDVAGSRRLFGSPEEIAAAIRERVRIEAKLPISVGAARTKHLAKIASQVAKPDGLLVVDPARETAFLAPLPVRLVWGVGPATEARLRAKGITTVGELAKASPDHLARLLGRGVAGKVRALANNDDARRVEVGRRGRSMGAQSALGRTEPTPEVLAEVLGHLADRVATRLRKKKRAGRTVTVRVRFPSMRSITRSETREDAVLSTLTLREIAEGLVRQALSDHPEERVITLLGISVSNMIAEPDVQLEFPPSHGKVRVARVRQSRWPGARSIVRSTRSEDGSVDARSGTRGLRSPPAAWCPTSFGNSLSATLASGRNRRAGGSAIDRQTQAKSSTGR